MSKKHSLLKETLVFGALTLTGLHLLNRMIDKNALKHNLLNPDQDSYYHSSIGDLYYRVDGIGKKPLLLLHDLCSHSCSNEWKQLIKKLSYDYTIYTLDLPGCGRSAKPAMTYTNYMYIQCISSFIKDVIREDGVTICTSGFSGSLAVMLAKVHPSQVGSLFMINPPSLKKLARTPDIRSKLLQMSVNMPIIGTAIYNLYNSRRNLEFIIDESWHNPFHIQDRFVLECYEAAHYDHGKGKYLQASLDGNFINWNIRHLMADLSIPITVMAGEKAKRELKIASDYGKTSDQIRITAIPEAKLYPHIENPDSIAAILH